MTLKMPDRQPEDGAMGVNRIGDGRIGIEVTDHGKHSAIAMSEYNAWRVFGALSLILGIPLTKAAGKAIVFGGGTPEQPTTMRFSRNLPPDASLGQRLAAHLVDEMVVEKLRADGHDVELAPSAQRQRPDDR